MGHRSNSISLLTNRVHRDSRGNHDHMPRHQYDNEASEADSIASTTHAAALSCTQQRRNHVMMILQRRQQWHARFFYKIEFPFLKVSHFFTN
jgi:hypothetical protein